MSDESDLKQLGIWQQEPTSVRAILDSLAGLWQSGATPDMVEGTPLAAVLRTSVLTMVVIASSRGIGERAASALRQVSGTHPSRCILVVAHAEDAGASLGASTSAHCLLGEDGRRRFCFEQIDLTLRGGMVAHLPGIVRSLLIHDLPTLLWWPGDPPLEKPLFTATAVVADRVVIDSSDFADPIVGLSALAGISASRAARISLSDLNWDRLIDWREMLAQFFDAAAARPYLDQVHHVGIDYAFDPGGQHHSAQALLFIGWLASCLGWQFERMSEDGTQLSMHAAGGPVAMSVASIGGRSAAPGSLLAVRLEAQSGDQMAHFTLAAETDGEYGTATIALPESGPVARMVRLHPQPEAVLLGEEMEALGHERAYESALHAVGELAHTALTMRQ